MLKLRLIAACIVVACFLTACSAAPDSQAGGPTPTPLPTTTAPDYPVVATQACQLSRFPALRTRQPQGDQIAWSPDSRTLAFVTPASTSNWFSGVLQIVSAPEFGQTTTLSSKLLVFGDLTWAPDGSRIAYVIFRQPDTYSAAVSSPLDAVPLDLFNNVDPRTDVYGGSKVIQGWRSPTLLRVLSSCGQDCDQTYEIDLQTLAVSPKGEQLRKAKNRFDPEPNLRDYDETNFPVMWQPVWDSRLSPQMKRPTWTQDGVKVAYIDRFIVAWVLRVDRKLQYMLDTPYVDVQELKWSPDGRYLALRTDDDVYVYDTECSS